LGSLDLGLFVNGIDIGVLWFWSRLILIGFFIIYYLEANRYRPILAKAYPVYAINIPILPL
jgi:hypothetical protein